MAGISSVEAIIEALGPTPDLALASGLFLGEIQKLAPCQMASAHYIGESQDEVITVLFASTLPVQSVPGDTGPLTGSWVAHLIDAGLPCIDLHNGQNSSPHLGQEYREAGIRSSLWVPLNRHGRLLGLVALYSQEANAFDAQVLRQVEALADRLTLSIAAAASYLRGLQYQKFARALHRASQAVQSGPDAESVLQTICQESGNLLGASQVILGKTAGDVLVRRLVWPPEPLWTNGHGSRALPDQPLSSLSAGVALRGAAEVVNQTDGAPHTRRGELSGLGDADSVMAVPLMGKDRVIGVLEFVHQGTGRSFTNCCVEMAEAFASLAVIALQNAQLREETLEALRNSEAQERAILEAVPDAMFRIRRDGAYLDYIAPADFELVVPGEEFLGNTISDVMPDHIARQSLAGIARALSTRQVQTLEYQLSVNDRDRDYEARIVASGEDEVLAIVRDVTERNLLEAQLLQSQKLESLGRLAGGIAHDFNNLLGGIMGYASLLKGKLKPSSEAHEFASIIEKATQRGAQLTQQLLTAARKSPFEARPVDVSEVMHEIVQILSHTLSKEIKVVSQLQPDLPPVRGDQTQIHQVLMNLCINAADAMPEGGSLTLSNQEVFLDDAFCQKHPAVRPGQYIQLAVSDTGIGISEAEQPKIFDPFFTTKGPGKGTGLGLAVVYAIVKNHQGLIEVTSALNQGSRFTVYLPACHKTED